MSMKALTIGYLFMMASSVWSCDIFRKKDQYFTPIEISTTNTILNYTGKSYLDTIIHVGLNEANIHNVVIILENMKSQPKSTSENLVLDAYVLEERDNVFYISISDLNRYKSISALSHEIIHIQQYISQRLQVNRDGSVIWENGTINNANDIEYMDRPWELEAFKNQNNMRDQIENELYK